MNFYHFVSERLKILIVVVVFCRQSGALNAPGAVGQNQNVPKDLQQATSLTTNMQQQASIPRATVHPFNSTADSRQLPPVNIIFLFLTRLLLHNFVFSFKHNHPFSQLPYSTKYMT